MLWAAAVVGYGRAHLTAAERILAVVAAVALAAHIDWSDEIGYALAAGLLVWHWLRTRSAPAT
jgi:TRAP-type uncharacterized transport system fused permease subunit